MEKVKLKVKNSKKRKRIFVTVWLDIRWFNIYYR